MQEYTDSYVLAGLKTTAITAFSIAQITSGSYLTNLGVQRYNRVHDAASHFNEQSCGTLENHNGYLCSTVYQTYHQTSNCQNYLNEICFGQDVYTALLTGGLSLIAGGIGTGAIYLYCHYDKCRKTKHTIFPDAEQEETQNCTLDAEANSVTVEKKSSCFEGVGMWFKRSSAEFCSFRKSENVEDNRAFLSASARI